MNDDKRLSGLLALACFFLAFVALFVLGEVVWRTIGGAVVDRPRPAQR